MKKLIKAGACAGSITAIIGVLTLTWPYQPHVLAQRIDAVEESSAEDKKALEDHKLSSRIKELNQEIAFAKKLKKLDVEGQDELIEVYELQRREILLEAKIEEKPDK